MSGPGRAAGAGAVARGVSGPGVAMVLAAGLGTRMRPLTDHCPKPLIEVAGVALIDRALDLVAAAGVGRAVVNVHYLAPMLRAHLAGRVVPEVVVSDESDGLLDTGGGVARALPMLGGAFHLLNCDAVWGGGNPLALAAAAWDDRLNGLLVLVPRARALNHRGLGDFHLGGGVPGAAPGAGAGVAPGVGVPVRRGGAAEAPYVYGGAAIMAARAFAGAPGGAFSLNVIWDRALAAGRLGAVVHDGPWVDVGTPEGIAVAEAVVA